MPANLSPEYKEAEAAYRRAREPAERLQCLREMLRTIPKHKGTEHLQADIKTRIKDLSEALTEPRKGAARRGPTHVVRPEGAAQVAVLGPPNCGKSTLHAALTGARTEVGPYPYATREPEPGMLPLEDIHMQLVDLPSLSEEHPVPWIGNALQPADACLLVVDLADPACVDGVHWIRSALAEKRVTLIAHWPHGRPSAACEGEGDAGADSDTDPGALGDPFAIVLPTLLVANKVDLLDAPADDLAVFRELAGVAFPALAVSATGGAGLERIAPWLFEHLGIVRVYTKAPGRPADRDQPFTVRRGDTVRDVAALVHRDIAESLRFAKLWGESGQFSGQQVGRDHRVEDGDVVELHA